MDSPNCSSPYKIIFLDQIIKMPHIFVVLWPKTDKALLIYLYSVLFCYEIKTYSSMLVYEFFNELHIRVSVNDR